MNIILLEPAEAANHDAVHLTDHRARHLLTVLKATPGQTVRVGVVNGPAGSAVVTATSDASVTIRCTFEASVPEEPRVDLLLAVPRPKVLRRLWAQLAALGVSRIALTNAARVERNYFDTHVLTEASYRPLLIEGLQQARDTHLPRVTIHREFRPLVEDQLDTLFEPGLRLLAEPGSRTRISDAAGRDPASRVLLAIGPEGGWNDFERRLLEQHGFMRVGMGNRVLRVDTACIMLLALVHEALERPAEG